MEKKQKTLGLEALQEAPTISLQDEGQLLYDLAIIVGATYQQAIEPTQAGKVPKRLANKIFPLLHGSRPGYYGDDDHYLDMLFLIALHLELVSLVTNTGQKARYMPGPQLATWAGLQPYEQVRLLLNLWWGSSNGFWSDVAGVDYRPDNFSYYMNMHYARKTLVEYIVQECQFGQWYTLEALLQHIKERNPMLLRTTNDYHGSTAYIRRMVLANWEHSDSQVIAGILASSLYELGMVTLGYQAGGDEEQNNIYAFQLTNLAAVVLGANPMAEEPPAEPLQRPLLVQPNFELLLLHPDFPTLYQLLPFVKVEQIEMVSRLTLTQESVRRGVEAGWGVERSLHILRTVSQKDLPQNVLYTMQDWAKFYKDATVSQVLLLEVSSEAVADEICASAKFRALGLRRLGPCAILIGGQVSVQVLRTTLEKEGVILRVQGDILTARETAAMVASTSYSYGRSK